MSAPLVVNTTDGTVWVRRASTRGGLALYAPAGVCSCPEFVMATEAELAEHGIVGSADVLPVPVGSGLSEVDRLRARVAELEELLATAPLPVTLTAKADVADGITRRIAPTQAFREDVEDVSPKVQKLRGLLAGQREDAHDGPLARKYLVGRDLPETGGAR